MFFYKKITAIAASIFYIFVNCAFYNSIFHEYTNDKLFQMTTCFGIIEVFFWITLFFSIFQLEDKSVKKIDKTREEREKEAQRDIRDLVICFFIFMASLICVDISRVILTSSPYINDIASTVGSYTVFIGGTRILFIFSAIIFIFITVSRRNALLIVISAINIIVSIMIWLDFDANITAIMRIIIAILAIIYYLKNDIIKFDKRNRISNRKN